MKKLSSAFSIICLFIAFFLCAALIGCILKKMGIETPSVICRGKTCHVWPDQLRP